VPDIQATGVNRLVAFIADWLDAAAEDGPASWLPRGLVIGAVLILVAGGAVLATSLLSREPGGVTGVPEPVAPEPSEEETLEPTDGVAGSRRLVADFDMLPTGSELDGWTLTEGARLDTAARPTAVDRSARLAGERSATACQALDIELATLEATFMIDGLPEGEVTLLALALDGGSEHRLTLTDGSATAIPTGDAVALQAGTWYRWAAVNGDEGLQLRLLTADGTLLTEATAPQDEGNARATEFCMTAAPSTRLYLSDLTVETP
jgi:hypothetical protein